MEIPDHKTISRLPASRFPDAAEAYFCDDCGRDLTNYLHRDRAPVWQPLRPVWYVCPCGRRFLSGGAEWDDLTAWERNQRIRQLSIGFALLAVLVTPVTLAYFALSHGGTALLAVVAIALIPSILAARPFWFVLLDVYEIIASVWRTRGSTKKALPDANTYRIKWSRVRNLRLTPIGAVVAVLIIATRWIPTHLGPPSSVDAASSRETLNAGRLETPIAPADLPVLLTRRARVAGAPSPAFRRVRVGPNEVDYIAEDVTIRHFNSSLAGPRIQAAYNEVHIGTDVTVRNFASELTVESQSRPVSQPISVTLSK